MSHDSDIVIKANKAQLIADTNIATADTLERKLRTLESEFEKLQLEKTLEIDTKVRKLNEAW